MDNQRSKSLYRMKSLSGSGRVKMSLILSGLMLLGLVVNVYASEYVVDNVTSKVKWEAKKVTGRHHGTISFENGSVTVTDNKISGGTFVIDMKSIVDEDLDNVDMNKKLMGHLFSDDFFSVDKFPESKMVITKVAPISENTLHFFADLTIKGVTNPVEFDSKVSISGKNINAEGIITVNRTLYGIRYGSGKFFQGLGDKMIFDDFTLAFSVVALKN